MYTDPYTAGGLRSDHAYGALKQRLLAGEFPPHARLGEERLASLLGVSRTPIREALLRLAAEGIVARSVDGGFHPVVPDVVQMRELYEVRIALELAALQRPNRFGSRHDAALLEELRDDWRHLAVEDVEVGAQFVLVDESFHVGLAEAAGNPSLTDLLRQVNERIRIVRMQDFLAPERIEQTIAEHLAVLDAVLVGDHVLAEQRLASHVEKSVAVVEQRVVQAIARMNATDPARER